MPDNFINHEILLFLEKSLKETVLTFLPKKETLFLPPDYSKENSPVVFYDYIFAIEKILNTHVIPGHYSPLYSTKVLPLLADEFFEKRIEKLVKFFEAGDDTINHRSVKVLPKSAYRYFNSGFYEKKNRYNIDYICDAHGIRHTHLIESNDDCLLFYALTDKNILLLSIGTHKDIYENDNLRVLINEFPEFLDTLGIHEIKGISPGIEESGEILKLAYKKNAAGLPSIDGKTYSTAFRTFSGIGIDVIQIFQEIIYQIETASIAILRSLSKDYNLFVKKSKSKLSVKYGYIYIGDRVTKMEWALYIAYLEKIRLVEMITS